MSSDDDDDDFLDDYYSSSSSNVTIEIDSEDEYEDEDDQEELMEEDDETENGRIEEGEAIHESMTNPPNNGPISSASSNAIASPNKADNEKHSRFTSTQVDSDNCCIICTEMWTNSDEHHVVSLKCGHLFGKSCIENWLSPSRKTNRCPQCNKPAKKRDVFKIYARCLKPLDTWEKEESLKKAKFWEDKAKSLEMELGKSDAKNKVLSKENDNLKYQLINHTMKSSSRPSCSINANINSHISGKIGQFHISHFKDIDIQEGGSRLHCYSKIIEALAISVPNPNQNNPLFPNYGFKKIPLNSDKSDFIFIHNKQIKDMAMNQYDGTITTVSLDKTLKITSLISKSVISSVNLSIEPWSVYLYLPRPNLLFTGLKNGDVVLYDKRMLNKNLLLLTSTSKSPVVSLSSAQFEKNGHNNPALLSVQLDTCSVYNFSNVEDPAQSDYQVCKLPFEGKFTSSHYDPLSGLSLLSCRPSQKHKKVTHYVSLCVFVIKCAIYSCNVILCFRFLIFIPMGIPHLFQTS